MSQHVVILVAAGLSTALKLLNTDVMQPAPWPVLKERHEQFVFTAPDGPGLDRPYVLHLEDVQGQAIYQLECHSGEHGEDELLKWSGLYQCALFPTHVDSISDVNVLAADTKEEQRDDGWNRGRILVQQFHTPCVSFPEYSTLRHFRLRGFDLTLGFTDLVWQGPKLQKFTLHVDVAPDVDAKSDVAETAAGDRPPHACYPGPKALAP